MREVRIAAVVFGAVVGLGAVARADAPVVTPPVVTPPTADAIPPQIAALVAKVDTVAAEVAKVRGLPLKAKVAHDVIDRVALKQRLVTMAGDDRASTLAEGKALERWGELPPGTDYEALAIGVLDDQIAGFYDPKTKAMTFISSSVGSDPNWGEMVLAHELDHALQDQSFDLEKFEAGGHPGDPDDDALMARHALVEGDGVALMIEVLLTRQGSLVSWANPTVAALIESSMSDPSQAGAGAGAASANALDTAPVAVKESMIFPYKGGFHFVAALRRAQPWSAVDGAFKRPPRSTEQVMHPDKYVADEVPVVVSVPAAWSAVAPAGFAQIHQTVWGEFGFATFLKAHGVDGTVADVAAAGWGGDRAVVLAKPGATDPAKMIGLSRSAWDTEADAVEAAEALTRALDDATLGATVTHDAAKTTWLALDGTTAWIERRGSDVTMGIGAPAWVAPQLAAQLWSATSAKPGKK